MTNSPEQDASTLAFQLVRSADEFYLVADDWSILFNRTGCATPALTGAAVSAYLSHRILPGEEPAVVVARSGTEMVAALPLVAVRRRRGYILRTFSDLHTYGVDILVDPAWHRRIHGPMLEWLMRRFSPLFAVHLADVRASSATIELLPRLRRFLTHLDTSRRASYCAVPANANDFVARLSHNFRKNLRKQEARLRALPDVRVEIVSAASATPSHFDQFTALELSGWKGRNGTAIASSSELLAYYRDLATGLANSGHLEWQFLWAGEDLISANLSVRTERVLTLLKIAYAERYAACGPGNMLFLELLRREAIQRSGGEIDCLTDMPWHRNWQMARRDYVSAALFPRRPRSLLYGYVPAAARDILRQMPALRALVRRLRRS